MKKFFVLFSVLFLFSFFFACSDDSNDKLGKNSTSTLENIDKNVERIANILEEQQKKEEEALERHLKWGQRKGVPKF